MMKFGNQTFIRKLLLSLLLSLSIFKISAESADQSAREVLNRLLGEKQSQRFELIAITDDLNDWYEISVANNKVQIKGNSPVALCSGSYRYLKKGCHSIISWSGNRINIPEILPHWNEKVDSPYQNKYYFNVVTHGYSTAYWDWNRWEQEFDWMAVHGIDMPLMPGAHEAILKRVWERLGLTDEEIKTYFSGPAHFPWNRMGNLIGWDGPLPASYFDKQIELTHLQMKRIKELQMKPIVPAFAGFVPPAILNHYPDAKIEKLHWDSFKEPYNAHILLPGQPLFEKIGRTYIIEWEKEFGKGKYYLADNFNEMHVPVPSNEEESLPVLAGFGESVYRSIADVNPDAVWVMQSWAFRGNYQFGRLFWNKKTLGALVSSVPKEKLLFLDLANDYSTHWWKEKPMWDASFFDGFLGYPWIYSNIPNMGGKSGWTGFLDFYATGSIDALNYEGKGNLVGYGMAMEGIENNEMIYELLSDMIWQSDVIDLDTWLEEYAQCRYGACPSEMKQALMMIRQSVYSSFTDHPRFGYQVRKHYLNSRNTAFTSKEFDQAIELFAQCSETLSGSKLYQVDLIELTAQYLSSRVDKQLVLSLKQTGKRNQESVNHTMKLMQDMDRLLESHPTHSLNRWVEWARQWGDTIEEKNYYESNAKRLVSSWGYTVDDYSARIWSGLIRDFYIPRMVSSFSSGKIYSKRKIIKWEEQWVTTPGITEVNEYIDPVDAAVRLIHDNP